MSHWGGPDPVDEKKKDYTGQKIFVLFFILIFWCFFMFFGVLSPKMTLVFS